MKNGINQIYMYVHARTHFLPYALASAHLHIYLYACVRAIQQININVFLATQILWVCYDLHFLPLHIYQHSSFSLIFLHHLNYPPSLLATWVSNNLCGEAWHGVIYNNTVIENQFA